VYFYPEDLKDHIERVYNPGISKTVTGNK